MSATTEQQSPTQMVQPPPTRFRRMLWPVVGVGTLIGATAYLATVDPNSPGHYPVCPLKALTGIDCPACGGLRCVHDLTHGDIVGALDQNLLVVILLPIIVVLLAVFLLRRWTGRTKELTDAVVQRQKYIVFTLIAVGIVFSVVRNLPFVPFLGSGIG